MNWRSEWKRASILLIVFLAAYYLPMDNARFGASILQGLELVKWYAREHVLLCLVPAFFIAGAISVFVSQAGVMRYLGPNANKALAYSVASVSGTVLAVCSCTVLPLFAGIYRMGAGLGPASAFLYSGPAINVLAIVLTARVLGLEIGIARVVGAVGFSVIIGLLMHLFYRKEENAKAAAQATMPTVETTHPLYHQVLLFAALVAILVFANWARPIDGTESSVWQTIYSAKWAVTFAAALGLGVILAAWFGLGWGRSLGVLVAVALTAAIFHGQPMVPFVVGMLGLSVVTASKPGENQDWFDAAWGFAKQILPLLLIGVFVSGVFLGRPGQEGLIPSDWVRWAVGGNGIAANFFAALAGAFMYFATLTEVPILQGLIQSGMGKGPALALLLAGPALSLPSMLVLRQIMGTQKTLVFVSLVVVMATLTGIAYGALFPAPLMIALTK